MQKALKNRPRRAAIKAVEIPITRLYHYICSDIAILVQLCVTYVEMIIEERFLIFCAPLEAK